MCDIFQQFVMQGHRFFQNIPRCFAVSLHLLDFEKHADRIVALWQVYGQKYRIVLFHNG